MPLSLLKAYRGLFQLVLPLVTATSYLITAFKSLKHKAPLDSNTINSTKAYFNLSFAVAVLFFLHAVRLFVYYAVNWFYGRSINCCRFLIKETHCRQAYRPRHGWINKSDGPQYEQRNGDMDEDANADNWAAARTSRAGRQRAYANGF